MTHDWAADVKKYVPDPDQAAIKGIVRHCGIALQSRDGSLVAMTDKTERDRVRDSFLKKKLELVGVGYRAAVQGKTATSREWLSTICWRRNSASSPSFADPVGFHIGRCLWRARQGRYV